MSLDEILADVKPEGDTDPFKDLNKETETPSESPAEKEVKVEEPVQGNNTEEKDIPFHKHPRWMERENELKELREFKEKAAPTLEEFNKFKSALDSKEQTNIPEWFKELYGENEVAWQKYSEHTKNEREEMMKELQAKQEADRQAAQKEEQKWNKWVEDGLDGLKILGLEFDRNALVKTMLDNQDKVTRDGQFDFNLGYKLYRELNPDNSQAISQARKKLADTTTKSSSSEKGSKGYMTSNELRGKSWNQLGNINN